MALTDGTTGYKFYGDDGTEQACFKILKDHGINTIRLRTWVNPNDSRSSGHNIWNQLPSG